MTLFEYKPGYKVSFDGTFFQLSSTQPDAYGGPPRLITYTSGGEDTDESYRAFLRRFEMHEVDEWAKRNGKRCRTPHGPGIDPDPG